MNQKARTWKKKTELFEALIWVIMVDSSKSSYFGQDTWFSLLHLSILTSAQAPCKWSSCIKVMMTVWYLANWPFERQWGLTNCDAGRANLARRLRLRCSSRSLKEKSLTPPQGWLIESPSAAHLDASVSRVGAHTDICTFSIWLDSCCAGCSPACRYLITTLINVGSLNVPVNIWTK